MSGGSSVGLERQGGVDEDQARDVLGVLTRFDQREQASPRVRDQDVGRFHPGRLEHSVEVGCRIGRAVPLLVASAAADVEPVVRAGRDARSARPWCRPSPTPARRPRAGTPPTAPSRVGTSRRCRVRSRSRSPRSRRQAETWHRTGRRRWWRAILAVPASDGPSSPAQAARGVSATAGPQATRSTTGRSRHAAFAGSSRTATATTTSHTGSSSAGTKPSGPSGARQPSTTETTASQRGRRRRRQPGGAGADVRADHPHHQRQEVRGVDVVEGAHRGVLALVDGVPHGQSRDHPGRRWSAR